MRNQLKHATRHIWDYVAIYFISSGAIPHPEVRFQECQAEFTKRMNVCLIYSGIPLHRSSEFHAQANACISQGMTYFITILRGQAVSILWGLHKGGDIHFGLCLPCVCKGLQSSRLFGVMHAYLVHQMPGTSAHLVLPSGTLSEDNFAIVIPLEEYARTHVQEVCLAPYEVHAAQLHKISGASIEQAHDLHQQEKVCSNEGFQYFMVFVNLSYALSPRSLYSGPVSLFQSLRSRALLLLGMQVVSAGFFAFGTCLLRSLAGQCSDSGFQAVARLSFFQGLLSLPDEIVSILPSWEQQSVTVRPFMGRDISISTSFKLDDFTASNDRYSSVGASELDPYSLDSKVSALRIFNYPLPRDYNEGLVDRLPDVALDRGLGHSEALLRDALNTDVALGRCFASYEHRVVNPDDADLFFVPSFMSFFVYWGFLDGEHKHKHAPLRKWPKYIQHLVEEGNASILETLTQVPAKYFERHEGRDHIILTVSGGPVSSMESLRHPPIRILDAIYPHDTRTIDTEYVMRWERHGGKDIIVPWRLMRRQSDYPSDADMPIEGRRYFMFFAASFNVPPRARHFRELAASLIEKEGNSLFINLGPQRAFEGMHDLREMAHARFCLETPGDTERTERPFDALFFGCIPVRFATELAAMPFEEDLKWDTFSLQYNARLLHQPRRLLNLLRAIPLDRLTRLQLRGQQVRRYLSVDERCERRPNAFDLVLRNLAKQHARIGHFKRDG